MRTVEKIFLSLGLIGMLFALAIVPLWGADGVIYVYDSLNRIVEIRYEDRVVHFSYDAAGNRILTSVEVLSPSPSIGVISPRGSVANNSASVIQVYGSNFNSSSNVEFNGSARPTTFINSAQLSVTLLPGDVAVAGTASIVVVNPAPNVAASNAILFPIVETAAVSGRVTNGTAGLANVSIALTGTESEIVTTDANGFYNVAVLSNGQYTITPTRQNYSFTPANREITYSGASQANLDFAGSLVSYSISGRVADAADVGIPGVTISLSGSETGQTTTNANGEYTVNATAEGNYTITPSRANYTFAPLNATFSNLSANQSTNFTANLNNYSISGRIANASNVGISGVTVTMTGSQAGQAVTNANGDYLFNVPAEGTYTVTPTRQNYNFTPTNATYANLSANQTANFTAALNVYTISGRVQRGNGAGVSGVTITMTGSANGQTVTNASGDWTINATAEGNYTITPSLSGNTFEPANAQFNNLSTNVSATFTATAVTTSAPTQFDFDGDDKADVSIFRPSAGEWWYLRSSDSGNGAAAFGSSSDTIVPGDYTGDGKTDMAFFRPATGEWYILRSNDSTFYAFPFGSGTDTPVPADYDGDNKTDAAVFRPATAEWYIFRSSDGGVSILMFGTNGDKPVPADYDGDGKADLAIFRPNGGSGAEWWYLRSSDSGNRAFQFGSAADKTVQGDYTGDGKADLAFFRPSSGEWFILRSEDSSFYSFPFGLGTDTPSPGDYDGDGKIDAAVFRNSNTTWYANGSTAGTIITTFGSPGDRPVPNAYVR